MSNNNLLFDANSGAMDSPVFLLEKQVTVIATGMPPGDYITFEVVQLLSGDPAKLCGCRLTAASNATIELISPLMCPVCGPEDNTQEVRLTANSTFVILDAPQGALVRAIYHGTGVDDGTVKAWYNTTETLDLTDALRGCAPVEVWEDTGETRCNVAADILEVQQSSSCGGVRWVEGPALTWAATGETRCNTGMSIIEIQEVNNCGDFRWVEGPAFEWVNTGVQDCSTEFVQLQQVSPCGDLRWVDAPAGEGNLLVEWLPTGELICDTDLFRQERNQCGDYRLVNIGPIEWVPTGEQRCEWVPRAPDLTDLPQYTISYQEVSPCGEFRWTAPSAPADGTPTGERYCYAEDLLSVTVFTNPCGQVAIQQTFYAPETFWAATGQISCGVGEFIMLEEQNPCGGTRWVEDPALTPAWRNAGGDCAYVCDPDTGFLMQVQQSVCCGGGERLVQVMEDMGGEIGPVLPQWLATGTYRCNNETGMVELQERSQCNEYRWTACSPITWTATGETRVYNGVSQMQETNPCGETVWRDIPEDAINWVPTGVQACIDGFYHNQETDGFGNVRTVATTVPCGCGENPVLTNEYDSDWILYAARAGQAGFVTTQHVLPHGLPGAPDFVVMEFRCITAQGNYVPGDVIMANAHSADQQGGVSTGWAILVDATNISLAFDTNNGASLHQWNNASNFRLNNGEWEFRIRGYS